MQTPQVKTPLGIIALFVSLIEAFLAIPLTQLQGMDRTIVVLFVTTFPILVATLFFIVLWSKPLHLYDPGKIPTEMRARYQPDVMKSVEDSLEQATKQGKAPGPPLGKAERSQVMARAQRLAPLLQGARLLWVDDNPDHTVYERRTLQSLGVFVDMSTSTDEALTLLRHTEYDVVISDMARGGVPDEGLRFLSEMLNQHLYRMTIFYVGQLDPNRGTPAHAFAITNRPDSLIHYLLDGLERVRAKVFVEG